MAKKYDFSGWASRNNIRCSDGRTIKKDAFKGQDGQKVPLMWNHNHNYAENVLGHALLENRDEGVYAYCSLNDTQQGRNAKELVMHGDIVALSIYANKLKQQNGDVTHGNIREVSLVLAGANPGAFIETVISHSDTQDEEAAIYNPNEELKMFDEDKSNTEEDSQKNNGDESPKPNEEELKMSDKDKTLQDVFNTLSEEQKNVVYAMIGLALEEKNNEKEGTDMKHNAFDKTDGIDENVLSHAEITEIINDAKKGGSLKEAALAHSITDVEVLFPEAKFVGDVPATINDDTAWVSKVMGAVKKSPFSRIKTAAIDITKDNARAKGYVKGNQKVEEVITALKRATTPTTVYKLQKMDRDDIIDITDFDVVAYIKREMRGKLDEELARAIVLGDGRSSDSDDKINELNLRPILGDSEIYTIRKPLESASGKIDETFAKKFIKEVIRSRKEYKGSGNPSLFTTEDMLTEMLLIEDTTGRSIYDTIDKLTTKLRVKEIITIPAMATTIRTDDSEEYDYAPIGILVNLADYTVGANKGGEVSMFDDFDLNFNKYEYLIETRCSGALTVPYSAIAFELKTEHVGDTEGTEEPQG